MYATYAHNTDIVHRLHTANNTQDIPIAIELIYLRYTAFFIP